MAKIQKGLCKNYDGCDKADNKEVQEIKGGELFICKECEKRLIELTSPKKSSPTKFIVIAIVAVLLIGGGAFFMFGGDKVSATEDPDPNPSGNITVVDSIPGDVKPEDPQPVVDPEPEDPQPEPDKPQPTRPTNGYGTLDLGYATYTGDIKNGKPHGNGTLEYKKSQRIISSKDYVASPGEKVIGSFRDGKINLATWYQKDGNQVVIK